MKTIYPQILLGTISSLLACCGPPPQATREVGSSEQPGYNLQGYNLQGYNLQGYNLQGTQTGSATVQQISLGGAEVTGLQIQGTLLFGTLGGSAISGAGFIGATVLQQSGAGDSFSAVITDVTPDPQDMSGEILLYALKAPNPETGALEDICAPDPFGQSWAIPVKGTWDSTGAHVSSTSQFMFACTSGVIAKCMRWGYKPWKSWNGVSLSDYHQACTRMARADYCGDGVSHTANNTLIDVYDDLGIQTRTPPDLLSPMIFDGAWTPQGAYCVTKDRWLKILQLVSVTAACKSRFADLFPLVETSPVDPTDVCGVKRSDLSRSSVRMDNRSGLNVALF